MASSEAPNVAAARPAAPDYAVGGMVRALCCVRLVVLVLAAGAYLADSNEGGVMLVALAAAPFSFVPALNWWTRGPSYFRNGVLLAADIIVTALVLVELAGLPLIATYAAATVALWGVTVGLRIALVMSIPVALLLARWSMHGGDWRTRAVGVVTVVVIVVMAWAGSILGRTARRHRETEELLSREREALATAQERLRIARDLHDTVAGDLAGLTMLVQALTSRLSAESVSEQTLNRARAVDEAVRVAHRHTRSALDGLRATSATMRDAVEELVGAWSERTGVAVRLDLAAKGDDLPPALADNLLLMIRELLENVRKHARATLVEVRSEVDDNGLVLSVDDDGRGLSPTQDRLAGHHGMRGVQERAESFGGQALWVRSALGGTCAQVAIPLTTGTAGTAGTMTAPREVA